MKCCQVCDKTALRQALPVVHDWVKSSLEIISRSVQCHRQRSHPPLQEGNQIIEKGVVAMSRVCDRFIAVERPGSLNKVLQNPVVSPHLNTSGHVIVLTECKAVQPISSALTISKIIWTNIVFCWWHEFIMALKIDHWVIVRHKQGRILAWIKIRQNLFPSFLMPWTGFKYIAVIFRNYMKLWVRAGIVEHKIGHKKHKANTDWVHNLVVTGPTNCHLESIHESYPHFATNIRYFSSQQTLVLPTFQNLPNAHILMLFRFRLPILIHMPWTRRNIHTPLLRL